MSKRKKLKVVKAKKASEFVDRDNHIYCPYCKSSLTKVCGTTSHVGGCRCVGDYGRMQYVFTQEQVDNTYYKIRKYVDDDTKEFEYIVMRNKDVCHSWVEALCEIESYIINQEKYKDVIGYELSDKIGTRNSLDGYIRESDGAVYQVEEFVRKDNKDESKTIV